MRQIDKNKAEILSTEYLNWVNKYDASGETHPKSRTYYDDVVMNLYRCQKGVCAYTEMNICIQELYDQKHWVNGKYQLAIISNIKRTDHFGELEHFDPSTKKEKRWEWDNLFMIHAKVNSIKTNSEVPAYLKPDFPDYAPEKYFDYDTITHRFAPHPDLEEGTDLYNEVKKAIDKLCLNHGVVKLERQNYLNELKMKINRNEGFTTNQFFTAVASMLEELQS